MSVWNYKNGYDRVYCGKQNTKRKLKRLNHRIKRKKGKGKKGKKDLDLDKDRILSTVGLNGEKLYIYSNDSAYNKI